MPIMRFVWASFVFVAVPTHARSLAGHWQGSLQAEGVTLRLELHIAKPLAVPSRGHWTAWTRVRTPVRAPDWILERTIEAPVRVVDDR
jgi:hypothetical protein